MFGSDELSRILEVNWNLPVMIREAIRQKPKVLDKNRH